MDHTMSQANWNTEELSSTSLKILQQAGWHRGREVPVDEYEKANQELKLAFGTTAREFLRSVGGLTIDFPHFADPLHLSQCSFNSKAACDNANVFGIRRYEAYLGESLTIVGELSDGPITILVAESGKVFGGYEMDLISFGTSPSLAINNLCEGKELDVVEVPRACSISGSGDEALSPEAVRVLQLAGINSSLNFRSQASLVDEFISQFGGHTIQCRLSTGAQDSCHFFGRDETLDWQCSSEIQRVVGEPVTPVGELAVSGFRLAMTLNGRMIVFMPIDNGGAWQVGSSIVQAINNLVSGEGIFRL